MEVFWIYFYKLYDSLEVKQRGWEKFDINQAYIKAVGSILAGRL